MSSDELRADVHELRHGYNLADLAVFAKAACRRALGAWTLDFVDRFEIAHSAIAEALYTVEEQPSAGALVAAGGAAINDAARAEWHAAGISERTWQPMPGYERYWQYAGRPVPSHEPGIVDRLALWQIWFRLRDKHRRVLLAMASFEDPDSAARSLGMSYTSFALALSRARCAFFDAWHHGEKPSRLWRYTQRASVSRARVTASDLETIRDRRAAGETITAIAVDYGVGQEWLSKLLLGQTKPAPDAAPRKAA